MHIYGMAVPINKELMKSPLRLALFRGLLLISEKTCLAPAFAPDLVCYSAAADSLQLALAPTSTRGEEVLTVGRLLLGEEAAVNLWDLEKFLITRIIAY